MDILINNVSKSFGEKQVLEHVSAVLREGGCTGIMGRSGCGKTTLLRILMGLERVDEGMISGVPEILAAVFQEDRLCEGLSAVQNVYAVLDRKTVQDDRKIVSGQIVTRQGRNARVKKTALQEEIKENLRMVGLGENGNLPVRELSGGMKRRVAIVRACMAKSELLLLDEPFRGLDPKTKEQAADYILRKSAGKTVIMTTHDERELQLMRCVDVIRI